MRLALEQAQQAAAAGEVPVGAALVGPRGEILAVAGNQTERSGDPTAHAEMLCIRQAAARLGGWRLLDSTLYVTLEPCPMCAGALLQARVGSVVYGARNRLLGADGSWIAMLPREADSNSGSSSSSSDEGFSGAGARPASAGKPHPFHPALAVRRGVLEGECSSAMRSFFQGRRLDQMARSSSSSDDKGWS